MDAWVNAISRLFGGGGLVLLISVRLAAVLVLTPVLSTIPLPIMIRSLLTIGLSLALATGMVADMQAVNIDATNIVTQVLTEAGLGIVMGVGVLVAFGAFSIAGRLLDIQVGFGLAQVLDPVSRRNVPVLEAIFGYTGVLVFFLLNGHHALVRGVALSLERFPPGRSLWLNDQAATAVLSHVFSLFALGFALVAPVVLCVLLVELSLTVVARNLPQMNMFVLALPIKTVIVLGALMYWFSGIGGVMNKVYMVISDSWGSLMSLPPDTGVQGS